ncbi:MAG: GntR family transcriptional regulator [Nitrospinaceae bacterium]|nr:GntR family transcriptional regulator [Nitrospinaceae bacterium]MBT3433942.1 GntR family transcriptional regulator [Nitrospinaceae bacterium]MBT4093404.1 GntR family transcriptional regulator [Nitrospinaceae bacterium]MBT4432318.1 GntR family transcriptional regulator [Nitrospinaceae bacterium]MBT5948629.1 GntR family transcriptional regulator [Nitrospinaceae bacterium]
MSVTQKDIRREANLTELAYQYLEKSILDVRLAPGMRVSEAEVARSLQMSRGPVREALSKLESVGLVTREANRGARVTDFDEKELEDLDALRSHLLSMAGRLAAERARPDQIDKMNGIIEKMSAVIGSDDYSTYPDLNSQFHNLLNEMSGNEKLSEMINQIYRQISRYHLLAMVYREGLEDSFKSHKRILETIKARDAASAERELADHGRLSYQVLLSNFSRIRQAFQSNAARHIQNDHSSGSETKNGSLPSSITS